MRDKRMDNRPTPPEEILLIKVGHHLWRSWKRQEWPEKAVLSALEDVWQAKEQLRAGLRKSWLETVNNRQMGLRRFRANA